MIKNFKITSTTWMQEITRQEKKKITIPVKKHLDRLNLSFTHFASSYTMGLTIFYIVFLISISTTFAATNINLCQKNDSSTCKFGGVCTQDSSLSSPNNPVYICKCASIACIKKMPFKLVCAADDTIATPFPNDLCRRYKECSVQKSIPRICVGDCKEGCTDNGYNANEEKCPDNLSSYCLNYGECLIYSDAPKAPFCKCLKGYDGKRCERRYPSPVTDITNSGQASEEINFKLLFFCCLGVLVLVSLIQTIFCFKRLHQCCEEYYHIGPEMTSVEVVNGLNAKTTTLQK